MGVITNRSYGPLEYIRRTYNVPAFKNRVVKIKSKGTFGVITGASGPHVAVRLSEAKYALPYHPSDIDYLDAPEAGSGDSNESEP